MMNRMKTNGLVMAMALAAGTASAQQWVFDQDEGVKLAPAAAQASDSSVSTYTIVNDEGSFLLKIEDDEVVLVKVDDIEVPTSWVKETNDGWKLVDTEGDTLVLFRKPRTNTFWVDRGEAIERAQGARRDANRQMAEARRKIAEVQRQQGAVARAFERPKTMVGITYSEPGGDLRGHLGLGDRDVIVVESVRDGLPADKAGLKRYDVIVEIGDGKPGTGDNLREALTAREAGDKLNFLVIRGGEKKTVTLKLEKFDGEKLGTGLRIAPEAPEPNFPLGNNEQFRLQRDLGRLPGLENLFDGEGRIRFGDDGELALLLEGNVDRGRLEELEEEMSNRLEEYQEVLEQYEDMMDQFAEQLEERLEDRMEQMEDRLESILDRLERRLDD